MLDEQELISWLQLILQDLYCSDATHTSNAALVIWRVDMSITQHSIQYKGLTPYFRGYWNLQGGAVQHHNYSPKRLSNILRRPSQACPEATFPHLRIPPDMPGSSWYELEVTSDHIWEALCGAGWDAQQMLSQWRRAHLLLICCAVGFGFLFLIAVCAVVLLHISL